MIDILESKRILCTMIGVANAGGVIIVTTIGDGLVDSEYQPKVISKLNAIHDTVELITARLKMGIKSVKVCRSKLH